MSTPEPFIPHEAGAHLSDEALREELAELRQYGTPIDLQMGELITLMDEVLMLRTIVRKLVNEPPHEHRTMQWYVSLDDRVMDLWLDHLTEEEVAFLRSLKADE